MLDLIFDRLNQRGASCFTLLENDEGLDRFPLGLVRLANDSGFRDGMVAHDGTFELASLVPFKPKKFPS